MKQLIQIAGGALAIYVVIVLAIAVIPAINLSQVPPGPNVKPLTPLQAEGRDIFAANGCSYCHTQQVRPIAEDAIWGRPSAPGDFAYMTPEVLGSERTGPDLTNVGKRQPSKVWQYIHLYQPRAVVPESIMPNFQFLFRVVDKVPEGVTAVPVPPGFAPAHGKVIPTHEAKALVAYLLSRKQAPIPGYEKPQPKPQPAPATSTQAASAGGSGYQYDPAHGKSLYTAHCAACHQASGHGIATAFPPLKGNPAVLADDPTVHIETILHGKHGAVIDGKKYSGAMPPFGNRLSDAEIAEIANYERSSWGNQAKQVTPADVAAVRAKGN